MFLWFVYGISMFKVAIRGFCSLILSFLFLNTTFQIFLCVESCRCCCCVFFFRYFQLVALSQVKFYLSQVVNKLWEYFCFRIFI